MERGDMGSFVHWCRLHGTFSDSCFTWRPAGTCRLLCSGSGSGILWGARAGHAVNEERKSDLQPQLPRLRGRGAVRRAAGTRPGAGIPSSPHRDEPLQGL